MLFIAPLLFNDGKRTPRKELWSLRAPILMLALGLVFATVLIAGYAIHSDDSNDPLGCCVCAGSDSVPDRCGGG